MFNNYSPDNTTINNDTLIDFLRCDLTGNLLKVPGIGKNTLKKLATGNEPIVNAYQLMGKFLSLRNINDTSESHCNKFLIWLKAKGIHLHCNNIVMAIAEKANNWIPGIYCCE